MKHMNIGGNLRRLRLEKGLTQEQLAEEFGVSPQAVSRWENDSAYPDITLLPGLAMLYGTSIDALVGMDAIRSDERLWEIQSGIYRRAEAGDIAAAVEMGRESLRLYPGNPGLLMALSETLARLPEPEAAEEAAEIAERVLAGGDISMKARATTMVNLAFLYIRAGRTDDARRTIGSLPHIWESREMLTPETCGPDEYEDGLRAAVHKALAYLCRRIDDAGSREYGKTPDYVQLGVDLTPPMDDSGMLEHIAEFLGRDIAH